LRSRGKGRTWPAGLARILCWTQDAGLWQAGFILIFGDLAGIQGWMWLEPFNINLIKGRNMQIAGSRAPEWQKCHTRLGLRSFSAKGDMGLQRDGQA